MNEGKYIFTKITSLVPGQIFQRLIEFCDLETGEELQFITNITDQLELNGLEIAIIAYLLLARVKALYDSPYSISEIGALVKVYGLVKMDLVQLVTAPQPLILNQTVNELTIF